MNSLKSQLISFKCAWQGVISSIQTQRHMKFHVLATIVVISLGIWAHISVIEWMFLIVVIGMVLITEMINTAIESTVDLCTQEIHPLAKAAKDIAAGAVLVASIVSLIIGYLIFLHPLDTVIQGG